MLSTTGSPNHLKLLVSAQISPNLFQMIHQSMTNSRFSPTQAETILKVPLSVEVADSLPSSESLLTNLDE